MQDRICCEHGKLTVFTHWTLLNVSVLDIAENHTHGNDPGPYNRTIAIESHIKTRPVVAIILFSTLENQYSGFEVHPVKLYPFRVQNKTSSLLPCIFQPSHLLRPLGS